MWIACTVGSSWWCLIRVIAWFKAEIGRPCWLKFSWITGWSRTPGPRRPSLCCGSRRSTLTRIWLNDLHICRKEHLDFVIDLYAPLCASTSDPGNDTPLAIKMCVLLILKAMDLDVHAWLKLARA